MLRTVLAGAAGSILTFALLSLQSAAPRTLPVGLTPEKIEILSHMKVIYLDDGAGGQAKTIQFEGVNVQVVGGVGTPTGLGNLIIGYNADTGSTPTRTGSHNLILGSDNSYTGEGGIVAGRDNSIGTAGVILGGHSNQAGDGVVLSGHNNTAGIQGVVLTGVENRALWGSAVATGWRNEAEDSAVILSGRDNYAEDSAVVVGGLNNTAASDYSAILGGADNTTPWTLEPGKDWSGAIGSCIVGGKLNTVDGYDTVVVGGESNNAGGLRSVVLGGKDNWTIWSGPTSVVAGGLAHGASGEHDFVAGSLFEDQ